jgi:prepilin-type N-terminal cleavage/methylation domain-containing protein
MRSERGYTLFEVLIVVALIGILTAISVPVFLESNARSNLWTGAEQMGAAVRSGRLKAISSNTVYRVVFNCPAANEVRVLVLTGDADTDNPDDFGARCGQTFEGDSGTIELPTGVAYDTGDATALEINGRGNFSAIGSGIPLTVTVTHGAATRTLTISMTGQITFTDVE